MKSTATDPWKTFKNEIRELTKSNNLETPPEHIKADISLPCFGKTNPTKYAQKKAEQIQKILTAPHYKGLIAGITATGPYLNFTINHNKYNELVLNQILKQKDEYGSGNEKGRILLEHTSINPTGPVHIGRLRNSLIGDSLKQILISAGYDVETHFYVNDMGKQAAIILWASQNNLKPDKDIIKQYESYKDKPDFKTMFIYVTANKAMHNNKKAEQEVLELLQKCEQGEKNILHALQQQSEQCIQGQKAILEKIGITFDSFDYESKFVENNDTEKVMKTLKPFLVEQDKTIGLDLSAYGLKRKKGILVLKRANNTSVYILRDIAYHLNKIKKHDYLINVVGEDHKIEMQELKFILQNFFKKEFRNKKMDVVYYAFVSFKDAQLSTRKGAIAPLDALLDQGIEKAKQEIKKRAAKNAEIKDLDKKAEKIAVAAIRYSILKQEKNKQMSFNWDQSLKFEGDTGPYLQYTYARAKSILAKSKNKPANSNLKVLQKRLEKQIIKQLSLFPSVLEKAAKTYQPHLIATYLNELASLFNEYYHEIKVLGTPEEQQRLALVQAAAQTIKNALHLLGIETMEKM